MADGDGSWELTLALSAGDAVERCTQIGVSPAAEDGLDRMDVRKPRSPGAIPQLLLRRTDWDPDFPVFGTDIRKGIDGAATWPVELAGATGREVLLGVEGLAQVPPEWNVYLIDVERARTQNLRAEPVYRMTPRTAAAQFKVVIGTPEAVQKELDSVLPKEFALENNFPNPFNPSTTFPVSIPRLARVALTVYNVLGEEVRTVSAGSLEAGRYWFTWDGRNNSGATVASGVYLTRLQVQGGEAFTRKMILMK